MPLRPGLMVPPVFAGLQFVANHLHLFSAWLWTPPGTHPMFVARDVDIAQHITWMSAMHDHWLIPDFHSSFTTVPGLFSPLMLVLGRIGGNGMDPALVYTSAEFVVYLVGSYALFGCMRLFLASRLQAYAALLSVFCALSVMDFVRLREIAASGAWKAQGPISVLERDGFILPGPLTNGVGTVLVLVSLAFTGSYIRSGRPGFLVATSLTAALSALLHPFETFAIMGGSGLSLIAVRWPRWRAAFREAAVISAPASLFLGIYAYYSLRTGWMQEVTRRNQISLVDFAEVWSRVTALLHLHRPEGSVAGPPVVLGSTGHILTVLGSIPVIFAVLFVLLRPPMKRPLDSVLRCWFIATLVIIATPKMPFRLHLWDGMTVVTSLLLVRQFSTIPGLKTRFARHRVVMVACAAVIVAPSLVTQVLHRYGMFASGNTISGFCSAVALNEELASMTWLRQHASPDDLVLAPPDSAGWIATVPIHSFAGHWLFSFDYATQIKLAKDFYAGAMSADDVSSFLSEYGIKYVLVPQPSPVLQVLDSQARIASAGTWSIYAYPRNHMQPYTERYDRAARLQYIDSMRFCCK